MNKLLLEETLFLNEGIFKKKKDPNKNYVTDSDLRSLAKCGTDLFANALARTNKELNKSMSLIIFKEDKNKVNKRVVTYAIGMVDNISTEMKAIIREEARKYKSSNKLFGGFKIESFGKGVAILVKLKGEYYYWKE